ncbi:hypothetical protein [Streptomyces chrestomyceticus]
MSALPESPSPRTVTREATGLLLVVVGALIVFLAAVTIHLCPRRRR